MSVQLIVFVVLVVAAVGLGFVARYLYKSNVASIQELTQLRSANSSLSEDRHRISAELLSAKASAQNYREALNAAEAERTRLAADIEALKLNLRIAREEYATFLRSLDKADPETIARMVAEKLRV